MGFVQLIEFKTTNIDAFNEEVDRWMADSAEWRTASRGTLCSDRDHPGTYMQIVEFPSYEAAMANSNDPRTAEFASRLAKLVDDGPTFRNLDVIRVETL
jgi:hypothetical protein